MNLHKLPVPSRHVVHVGGAGVVVPPGVGGVDVAHHTVTSGDDGAQGLGQLFLLFTVFGATVLKPHLQQSKQTGVRILNVHGERSSLFLVLEFKCFDF